MIENLVNFDEQESTSISKAELAELRGQMAALHQLLSVAEYSMEGKILRTNENFRKLTGYSAGELAGQGIGLLLDLKYRRSAEYRDFWQKLKQGESLTGKFKRITSGINTVWIQASYYPVLDLNGKPYKFVEYATDISEPMQLEQALTNTVTQVSAVMVAVTNGDLTQRVPLAGKSGDMVRICNDVNALIGSMAALVEMLKKTGGSIVAAANAIEAASTAQKALTQHKSNQGQLHGN
ncbi:MAG: PAS domain-containing protein [Methylophilaceae bacterium]|nr:PAS domain-containing protein [Methylophilaceae bacterium]